MQDQTSRVITSSVVQAKDMLALRDLIDDPTARRIVETVAAVSLIEDGAAKRNTFQALGLSVTAAAAHAMQTALADGQSGEFRDVAIERDGSIFGRFVGGRSQTVERYGDRLIGETADKTPLLAPPAA